MQGSDKKLVKTPSIIVGGGGKNEGIFLVGVGGKVFKYEEKKTRVEKREF